MRVWSQRAVAAAAIATIAVLAGGVANAQTKAVASANAKMQNWQASGGTVGIRWNRELAADIGLKLGAAQLRRAELSQQESELFEVQGGSVLDFDVRGGNLQGFLGGSLQARGGYVIESRAGRIDLTNFRMVPRRGAPLILDIVGTDGKVWFYTDRLMYELLDDQTRLAVRTLDIRITPELAKQLGQPEVADWVLGDMELNATIIRQGSLPQPQLGSNKFHGMAVPGVPGATFQADLFMSNFSVQYSRCDGCTGPGGPGRVVFTPSSTLRNNVNHGSLAPTVANDPLGTSSALYAADIPWYEKFTGNFAPYGNDQHPYLIWNLYRLNTDGTMDQIGRSGVKHAFLTINQSCIENPNDGHILGRGCLDTYAVSNNDSSTHLGPRSEIIPASNVWGRCGSIYDTNCDGIMNAGGNGAYDQRLITRESQFSGDAQAGATYIFESWYLARQDVNILNSMATKRVTFTRNGSVWSVGGNDQYALGPAIDRWVNPAAPGVNAASVDIPTAEGRTKIAVKATNLGNGQWRYDYAVMNLDFARAITQGTEPNLRVVSNAGFNGFTIPTGSATITDLKFSDGDLDASNDWSASVANNAVTWNAPTGKSLDWGTMFRFSFVANQAPIKQAYVLNIANAGSPVVLKGTGVIAPGIKRRLGPA